MVKGDTLQDMLESLLPPDAQRAAKSRPLLPGTLLLVPEDCMWASPALVLSARHSAVRAAATHAALMSCVLEAAGTCATPSVLQLSYMRYINPQVRSASPHYDPHNGAVGMCRCICQEPCRRMRFLL